MHPRNRIHYAWVIVAIAATMGCITSSVRFAAAALVPHLSDPTRDSAGATAPSALRSAPVDCLWAGEPLCGMARGPIRGSLVPAARSLAIHRRHVADRNHEQPVAILPLLRRGPGSVHDHLYRADGVRRHPVVQETLGSRHGGRMVVPRNWRNCVPVPDWRGLQPAGNQVDLLASWHSRRSATAPVGQVLLQRTRRYRLAPRGRSWR